MSALKLVDGKLDKNYCCTKSPCIVYLNYDILMEIIVRHTLEFKSYGLHIYQQGDL